MRRWILAGTLAVLPLTAQADPVALHDGYGYSDAVLRAELAKLQKLSTHKGAPGRLGAAGYYRVRGELDTSSKAAQQCLEVAAKAPPGTWKGIVFLCESTLAGNALIEGDIAQWATRMQKVRSEYAREVVPLLNAGDEVLDVTRPDFARFLHWPRSSLAAPAREHDIEVPIQLRNELPSITLTLHARGRDAAPREVPFIIDTGSARSHISRALAAELGLPVTEGFVVSRVYDGTVEQAGLAAPLDIEIGGQRVRDVSFNSEAGREIDLIGLDVLRALGRLRISRESLTLLAPDSPIACERRMATTSSLWGAFYQQRYPIRGGTENQLMLIDTGFNGVFQMRGAPRSSVPAAAVRRKNVITTRGAEDIAYAEASTPVTINDTVLDIPVDVSFQPPDLFPSSWRIGYGVTARYDLFMDVPDTHGCLVARPPKPPLLPAAGARP